jgi:hypothetical protein
MAADSIVGRRRAAPLAGPPRRLALESPRFRTRSGRATIPAPVPVRRRTPLELLLGLGAVALAVACVDSLHAVGWAYDYFAQPASGGVRIPTPELAFDLLYLAYGSTAIALLVFGLRLARGAEPLARTLRRAARWRPLPALLVGLVFVGALAARLVVLDRHPVTDDEEVHLFVARTLLAGGVTDEPGLDERFVDDEFVPRGANGRFGKYPVGHGAVLAAALAVGGLDFVAPLLAAVTAVATWVVARRSVGPRRALVALALLALSPHFALTHGTLLSQTTSTAASMAALALLASAPRGRSAGLRLAPAGAALALGAVARPLPGALFALVAAAWVAAPLRRRPAEALRALAWLGAPLLAGAVALGAVHLAQTGSPWRSGYHAVHGALGVLSAPPGGIGASLLGSLLRENFWLFGWPLSLAPIAFARPRRARMLLWGWLLAVLAYRVLVPKVGVSTTGPAYLLEAVPVLAVLAADGLARLTARLRRGRDRAAASLVPAAAVGAALTAATVFVPVELASLRKGAAIRGRVYELLAHREVRRALVFANELVVPRAAVTWAHHPPIPSPALDEEILFLRLPPGPAGREAAIGLWRERFADRPAFVFDPRPPARLRPLVRPAGAGRGGRVRRAPGADPG